MKHQIKLLIKFIVQLFGARILFSGEQTELGLRGIVIEYYLRQSKGVLHIGAHKGQEASYYADLQKPVLWIEGNPRLFHDLQKNICIYPNQRAMNALLGNENRVVDFYISSNDGLSSSVLPLTDMGGKTWRIENNEVLQLESKTLDFIGVQNLEEYDFWVVDVQGFELQVIEGAQNSISHVNWMLIECSNASFYSNMALYPEICQLLSSFNFIPILTPSGNHFEMLFKRVDT